MLGTWYGSANVSIAGYLLSLLSIAARSSGHGGNPASAQQSADLHLSTTRAPHSLRKCRSAMPMALLNRVRMRIGVNLFMQGNHLFGGGCFALAPAFLLSPYWRGPSRPTCSSSLRFSLLNRWSPSYCKLVMTK